MLLFRTNRRAFLQTLAAMGGLLGSSLLVACARSPSPSSNGASRGTSSSSAGSRAAATSATTIRKQPALSSSSAPLAVKELTFMRPSSGPEEDKAYLAMLSDWKTEHPDIKASFISVPYSNYESKLLTEIAGGVVRDVVGLLPGELTVFAAKQAILSLDGYVARSPQLHKDDFFPAHWADGQYQGKQWGVPPDGSPLVVAYNVDLFQNSAVAEPTPAWTWNDAVTVAQRLTKRSGSRITQFGCAFSGAGPLLSWLFANNANVINTATNKVTIDSANAVQTLTYLGDLNTKYHVNPLPAEQSEFGSNIFLSNKVAMIITNRGGLGTAYRAAPFKINVVPLPKGPASGHSGSQVTPLQMVIEKPNTHPDDAWMLLEYLASARSQLARFTRFGGYPSRRSVATNPKFLASVAPSWVGIEVNKVFAEVAGAPGTSFVPHHPSWSQISQALNEQLDYLWNGERPASVVAKAAAERITPLLT